MKISLLNILLIDENIKAAGLIQKHLSGIKEFSINLEHVTKLEKADEYFLRNSASMILLTLNKAGVNELERISRLRNIVPTTPIIVLLESGNKDFSAQSISAGADDYLLKDSLNTELTLRTFRYTIEQRNHSERVYESERKYEDLINLLPQIVFEMDFTGRITFANDVAFKTYGYSKEEIVNNMTAFQLIEEKDRARASQNIQNVIKGVLNKDNEYSMLKRDGTTFPALIFSNPIVRKGAVLGLRGIIIDITDRKKTEEKLFKSEERTRAIVEGTPYLFFYTQNAKAETTYVSPTVEQITGHSTEKWLHTKDWFITESEINQSAKEKTHAHLRGEFTPESILLEIRHADGHLLTLEVFENPIFHNGKVVGLQGVAHDVTKRLEAENKLIESEKRYREVVEEAAEIIFTTNERGYFTYANPAILKATGYSDDDLLNKNYFDLILPNHRRRIFSIYYKQLEERTDNTYTEYQLYTKDGTVRWFGQNARLIIENGIVKGFYVIARDITERIEAEEKIMLLSRAVEKSPASIMITNEIGNIEYINTKFTELTGYSFDEVKGKNPRVLKSGEKTEEEYKSLWETIKSGKEWRGEFHNRKKNGELYWESASIAPITNGNTFFLAVKEDITERKKSEERILLLANAIESVSECISITDMKDKILFTNNAFRETYGYNERELIGKDISMVRSQIDVSKTAHDILPQTKDGGWQGEITNRRKDGSEFPVYLSTAMIKDGNGQPLALIGVANDITERMRAHKELIEAKEKAEKSDKLKSEFLAQMSHEIRTPLNILLSYTAYIKEVLEERHNLTDDLQQYFTTTSNAGKRIIRTIELILNMSDLKSGSFTNEPKNIDVYEDILKQVFHQFYRSADESKIKFELIQKSDSLFSNIDPYAVEQVFTHIIDNAVKFTEKGHILIHAEKNQKGNTVIKIEDTGAGIGEEYMKILYTPFTQEDHGYTRSFDGNGLGLALVKKYCELNNIQIEVHSEKWKGSVFTLTFPQ